MCTIGGDSFDRLGVEVVFCHEKIFQSLPDFSRRGKLADLFHLKPSEVEARSESVMQVSEHFGYLLPYIWEYFSVTTLVNSLEKLRGTVHQQESSLAVSGNFEVTHRQILCKAIQGRATLQSTNHSRAT